jgi:hypothetical protein
MSCPLKSNGIKKLHELLADNVWYYRKTMSESRGFKPSKVFPETKKTLMFIRNTFEVNKP